MATSHKVFVSYHHDNDQYYRDMFEDLFVDDFSVFISKSVQIGDINPLLPTDSVRQQIRDKYLRDSTVTIVLIGSETWKRKHVDWEIASSIRQTQLSSRSGLLGLILPTHPDYGSEKYDRTIVPPRLAKNAACGFATIYDWSTNPISVAAWIEKAYQARAKIQPDNSFPHFSNNKSGVRWTE